MERGSEWEEGDVVGGEDKEDDGGEEKEWERIEDENMRGFEGFEGRGVRKSNKERG